MLTPPPPVGKDCIANGFGGPGIAPVAVESDVEKPRPTDEAKGECAMGFMLEFVPVLPLYAKPVLKLMLRPKLPGDDPGI